MNKRKLLSLLLAFTMLFTSIPVGMFAEGEENIGEEPAAVEETVQEVAPVSAPEVLEESVPAPPAPAPEVEAQAEPVSAHAEESAPATEPTEEPAPATEPAEEPTPATEPAEEPAPATEPTEEPAPATEPAEEPTPATEPTEEPTPATDPVEESELAEELIPEGENVPEEVTEQPAEEVTPAEEPEPVPVEEELEEENEMFQAGLAYLSAGEVFEDKQLKNTVGTVNGRAVVYATERVTGEGELSGNDVIRIVANIDGQEATLYVKNGRLSYLTESESEDYLNANHDNGITYRDAKLEPLPFVAAEKPVNEEEPEEHPAVTEPAEGEIPSDEPPENEPVEEETEETPANTEPADGETTSVEPPENEPVEEETEETPANTEPTDGETTSVEPSENEPVEEETEEDSDNTEPADGETPSDISQTDETEESATTMDSSAEGEPLEETAVNEAGDESEDNQNAEDEPDEEDDIPVDITALINPGIDQEVADENNESADIADNEGDEPVIEETDIDSEEDLADEELSGIESSNAVSEVTELSATATPAVAMVTAEQQAVFTVTVEGAEGEITYQWQYSSDNGDSWRNLGGESTGDTYSINAIDARLTWLFRCLVTAGNGSVESNAVHYERPLALPTATATPAVAMVTAEQQAVFTVTVEDAVGTITYQWQYSSDNGDSWRNLGGESTGDTYSINAIDARLTWLFRCLVTAENGTAASNAVHYERPLTLPTATVMPAVATVTAEQMAVFTVTVEDAVGTVTYQWQYSADNGDTWRNLGGDSTSDTYSINAIDARLTWQFRCLVTAENGTAASNAVHYERPLTQPTATVTPAVATVTAEQQAVFTVTVEDAVGTVTYQWQYSTDNGDSWRNLGGDSHGDTYSINAIDARLTWQFRCLVTAENGTAASNAVHYERPLTELTATVTPAVATVTAEQQAVFTVTVEDAVGTITYQWQYSADNGDSWRNLGGDSHGDTYSINAIDARLTWQFRCLVTAENGTVASNAVHYERPLTELTATVTPAVATVTAEQQAVFTVTVEDAVGTVTYQWQYSADNGDSWRNLGGDSHGDTYSINAIDARLTWQFRCLVTAENGTVASNAVHYERPLTELTATVTPSVAMATAEQQAVFTVTVEDAVGTVTYQWQYSADNGDSWRNLGGDSTGDTYSINAIDARLTWQFRCVVTAENGTVASNAVHYERPLTQPTATVTPAVATVTAEQMAVFTVTVEDAIGTVTYQWQYSADNGDTWRNLGGDSTGDTYSINAIDARLTWQFRCLVTAENGTAASNAVHYERPLTLPTATATPDIALVTAEQQAVFTVTVEDAVGTVTYQWQYSADNGDTWRNLGGDSTGDTYSINAIDARLTWQFRCQVTAENGIAVSNAVHYERPADGFTEDYGTYTITYTFLEESNCVSVTAYSGSASSLTIPTNPRPGYTVTKIGESCFEGHTELCSIDLPDTITVIGAKAFKGCTSLSSMNTH